MNDDIQFGEVQDNPPEKVRSPARDEHFSIARMGDDGAGDLPIFVDLDVFHELENHASSNTSVELGGVLLGRQAIDENGDPLVIVSDSLRAEHYEATRGSFKFTHSTWSEITRRRQQMNDSLQIVGWYHTHPGWGVFLSDMDDFICRNFFGRPLDVALVIDPRQGSRGWFQWDESNTATRQCAGYYLFSNRHRAVELQATVLDYSGAGPMAARRPSDNTSLRFQPIPSAPDGGFQAVGTWALIWLFGLQTLVLALIAWRILAMPAQPVASTQTAGSDPVHEQMVRMQTEARVYRELSESLLTANGQSPEIAEQLARLKLNAEQLESANTSHVDRIAGLESRLADAAERVAILDKNNQLLSDRLVTAEKQAEMVKSSGTSLNLSQPDSTAAATSFFQPWLIGILAVALVGLGIIVWRMNRRDNADDLLAGPDDDPARPGSAFSDIRMEPESGPPGEPVKRTGRLVP